MAAVIERVGEKKRESATYGGISHEKEAVKVI